MCPSIVVGGVWQSTEVVARKQRERQKERERELLHELFLPLPPLF
jgi:hypothetical protein